MNATPPEASSAQSAPEAVLPTGALRPRPWRHRRGGLWLKLGLVLRGALLRLADRVVPVEIAMGERAAGMIHTQLAAVLVHYAIPDLLREQGPLDARALAERTGAHADALHRLLRAATTAGVCRMGADGHFANNALSLTLCRDHPEQLGAFAEYFASPANTAAYGALTEVAQSGRESFSRANGCGIWEWFAQHPHEQLAFDRMMAGLTLADAPLIARLYPFGDIATLCDVGGGCGALLSELAVRHRHLKGLLYEREALLEPARALFAQRGVDQRLVTAAGDFFREVPAGYDAYLLKNILHDWDDEACAQLLGNCRRAMQPGQKLVVVEIPVEPTDRHNFASFRDVHVMTVMGGGRERGLEEYRQLLDACGFDFTRIYRAPTLAIMEFIAR